MEAEIPNNDEERLNILSRYRLLDSDVSGVYDDYTLIASHITQSPIALISLVDRDRQWFKSKFGLGASETSRASSFCAHAILNPSKSLIVEDATKDVRFMDNELVTGNPKIRFYCGMPLVSADSYPLGTLCVIDIRPRSLTKEQEEALRALSRRVMNRFEIQRTLFELEEAKKTNSSDVEDLTIKFSSLLGDGK